jgi:hypothetical protein
MFLARCAQCANFLATRLHRFKLRARPNGARGFLMRVNPYGTLAPNQEPVEVETEVGGVKVRQGGVRPGRLRRRNRLFDSCGRSNAVCKSLHSLI